MKRNTISVVLLGLLTIATFVSGITGCTAKTQKVYHVAAIRNLGSDDNTNQFLAGIKEEADGLGIQVDTFITNGDDAKFQDFVEQAIAKKYDGIILSHGKDPYSTGLAKKISENKIPLVVFDTALGEKIPGVTVTAQADESLAEISLGGIVKDFGGKAKIVKLWVAGFPPMERRQVVYKKTLEANPGIVELESIGAVSSDVPGDTANKINAILAKYPKGKIDAIWGSWDAFAQGAYKALKESGRTEIKIYSIDVSDQDLQLIQEKDSPWVSTAAVDPKLIGTLSLRLLAKKLIGEETPDTYEFKATEIRQADLAKASAPVNSLGLASIVPGWGQSDDLNSDGLKALREKAAKTAKKAN